MSTEHGPVEHRFDSWDRGVGVAHHRPGDCATFDYERRFHAKKADRPENDIGKLAWLEATEVLTHAMGDRRIDSDFREVAEEALIVVARLLTRKWPTDLFHLVGCLEQTRDRLTDAAHSLRV